MGDVIVYKTLTLCMETWQPLLSEWLCGRVTGVRASEIDVSPMELSTAEGDADRLQWTAAPPDDASVAVQIGEISELRYLEGPSCQVLHELHKQS